MQRLGYLASPYSHSDPEIREQRFRAIAYIAAQLMASGKYIFSPIAMCHPMAVSQQSLPGDYKFWSSFDENLIIRCDYFIIVPLDGWKTSKGIREEIHVARAHAKDVFLLVLTSDLRVIGLQPYKGELDG